MDLTQVESWTREALESEGRRIGIKGCEYRTRTELVRLILRDRYGDAWNAGRETVARGIRTLSEARAALGVAIERTILTVLDLRETPYQAHVAGAQSAGHGAREAAGVRATVLDARASGAADAITPGAPVAVTSDAPVAVTSDTPVAEAVLVHEPNADRVAWIDAQGAAPRIQWQASAAGVRRARAVLGSDGELAVRVVVVAPDAHEFVRADVIERGPVEASGEMASAAAPEGARRIAAVGLRADDRFVSIAHAAG
jgi:hypothetical protein